MKKGQTFNIKETDFFNLLRENNIRAIIEYEDFIIAWSKGHTAHVYNLQGEAIDCFSFGDFSKNEGTREEFLDASSGYVENLVRIRESCKNQRFLERWQGNL